MHTPCAIRRSTQTSCESGLSIVDHIARQTLVIQITLRYSSTTYQLSNMRSVVMAIWPLLDPDTTFFRLLKGVPIIWTVHVLMGQRNTVALWVEL